MKYDNNDCIAALKEKVKRKKQISLPANELAVWQCKEPRCLQMLISMNLKTLSVS